jgi:glycosyltransferase involved in cell wall biosynthesis
MKIFIVVPCYNEERHIQKVLKSILKTGLEVVVVNDGSNDNTKKIITKMKNKKLHILNHAINLGKGAAIKTGGKFAFKRGAEAIILMDSDGQHKVDDLDQFILKLKEGYQVVLGLRNYHMGVPLDRFLGNKLASSLVAFMFGIYVTDLICGFRAMTKKAFYKMKLTSSGYGIEVETVIRIKQNNLYYCEVPVQAVYYDSFKGASLVDAFGILFDLILWRIKFSK